MFGSPGLQAYLKADVALNAMGAMQYDCLNLSNKEFLFGPDFILDSTNTYGVPVVSANIAYADSAAPVAAPSRIITFDNFSVGITGILAEKYAAEVITPSDNASTTLTVLAELPALQNAVSVLRGTVDIVIVLANSGLEAAKDIARDIAGIDVIVAGHGTDETVVPMYINETCIVKTGYYGETIGNLTLSLDEHNTIIDFAGTVVRLDKTIEQDSDVLDVMEVYYKSLEQYKEDLFNIEQRVPDAGKYYVGADTCVPCHSTQHNSWTGSEHALAIESLEETFRDYDPECVSCHVTGIGYVGGFKRPDVTPELAGVQCEMCHGPGGAHLEDSSEQYGEIMGARCAVCHTNEKDPTFVFVNDKELVSHHFVEP